MIAQGPRGGNPTSCFMVHCNEVYNNRTLFHTRPSGRAALLHLRFKGLCGAEKWGRNRLNGGRGEGGLMGKFSRSLFLAALVCSAGTALAQAPPAPTPYTLPPGWIEPGEPRPPYVSPETPQGSGPHPAIMAAETIAPGADFVSYYPANLSQLGGKKLPILVWGNGSCAYVGNRFRHFLQDIASHDYFVLAGGEMVMDKGEAETIDMSVNPVLTNPDEPAPAAAPARAAPVTAQQNLDQSNDPNRKRVTYELLSKGVDWALAENKRPGSTFFGRLDTANIAAMGNSCGGGLASKFAGDRSEERRVGK